MDTGAGAERIEDAEELARVRRQARKVYIEAAAFAVGLTGLSLLLPR